MSSTEPGGLLARPERGYRFLPGITAYSAGVASLSGFEVHRASFGRVVPLEEGFRRIRSHLEGLGRPLACFCAAELRSPRPFSEAGFLEFNRGYVSVLEEWGLLEGGPNPIARSNVCPATDPPAVPGFLAFSYAMPGPRPGFVVAGNGEAPEGRANYRDHIVRRGDLSPEGLAEKVRWVLGEQERRMGLLGFGWAQVTAVQVYTVHGNFDSAAREITRRGAPASALVHDASRPPVVDIEFEMDSRGVSREIRL